MTFSKLRCNLLPRAKSVKHTGNCQALSGMSVAYSSNFFTLKHQWGIRQLRVKSGGRCCVYSGAISEDTDKLTLTNLQTQHKAAYY